MAEFEFYSKEHTDKQQRYIDENYAMGGCSTPLVSNALDFAANQSEDNESALLVLEMLLDGIGITREDIINAVTK